MQFDRYPYKKRELWTQRHGGECHVKTEGENVTINPQEWPIRTRSLERGFKDRLVKIIQIISHVLIPFSPGIFFYYNLVSYVHFVLKENLLTRVSQSSLLLYFSIKYIINWIRILVWFIPLRQIDSPSSYF